MLAWGKQIQCSQSNRLREPSRKNNIIPVETAKSWLLKLFYSESHQINGLTGERIPKNQSVWAHLIGIGAGRIQFETKHQTENRNSIFFYIDSRNHFD